jgi:hypothetical protein
MLMQGVETFLSDPGARDVPVHTIFTDQMFSELRGCMETAGMPCLDEVTKQWEGGDLHLRNRFVVSGFLTDRELGAKRLISMPDRVTNTINVVPRGDSCYFPPPVCRPSVINNYLGDMSSVEIWWDDWKAFMFDRKLCIRTKAGNRLLRPIEMLDPIPRSKYPAVTEMEERCAIPLQLLCQAIFDAVLVHLMNRLSPGARWQQVKLNICERLYKLKHERTVELLDKVYGNVNIMCLQEVAGVFVDKFKNSNLSESHVLVLPVKLDGKRDQNSVILLRKDFIVDGSIREVTSVMPMPKSTVQVTDGDFVAVEFTSQTGRQYLVVSFHGDTNGLLTLPVIDAVHRIARGSFPDHVLIFGLDANVYEEEHKDRQSFEVFLAALREKGMVTCFGETPDVKKCRTTCNARTSLQPQLNKAIRFADRVRKSDANPKDSVVFYKNQLSIIKPTLAGAKNPIKDNTGRLEYLEETVFPTLDFPSDHGIVCVGLEFNASGPMG